MTLPKTLKNRFFNLLFGLFGLVLPWQVGKHFWFSFSYVSGIAIDYLAPTVYLADLVLWLLTLAILIFQKLPPGLLKKHAKTLLLIVFVLSINFIVAKEPLLFAYRLYQYLKVITIVFIFIKISGSQIKAFFKGLSVSTVLALVLATCQVLNKQSLQGLWYFLGERSFTINSLGISTVSLAGQKLLRAYAFFSHPNSLAGFFLPLIFVFLAQKKQFLATLAVILVLLAFSRFHLIILGVGLLWWFSRGSYKCQLCQLSKIIFGLWLLWFSFYLRNDPLSLSSRINSIWPSLTFLWRHPLGLGLGHYLYPQLPPFPQPVHNVFLLISLEMGWLFWLLILINIKKVIAFFNKAQLSQTLLIIIFLTAGFDHYWLTLNQNLLLLGVLLGLIIGPWSKRQIPN